MEAEDRGARLRCKGSIVRAQRGCAVRGVCAADRRGREHGESEHGQQQEPLTRRVCLPKHGCGPYHTAKCGDFTLRAEKMRFLFLVCDSCALTFIRKGC